ncbi:Glycosylphosphatidylinositol specific phospholipase D1 [Gryganskiella cystojenkinii]|nr:Glycosylphosphatidylinositol specific phospholipase D1 [Gryganskiella cystojenkinii]
MRLSTVPPLPRVVSLSAVILMVLGLDFVQVHGCGITIHNEIAFRASQLLLQSPLSSSSSSYSSSSFAHIHSHSVAHAHSHENEKSHSSANDPTRLLTYAPLLERKESLFAGSFFPDWGYNCVGKLWNDAAEEAHWPPFAEAAVRYILETYPKPWTEPTKDLIAFLFGTVSHSLGDVSWHALRELDAGFIKAIAETSFDGDYSKAHSLADIGAEFVLSHMSKMDHLVTPWKVPVKDITAIYKRMGYYVPGPVLSHCMRNGYAGAQANARLGSQLFPVYASKSPFLTEQVENYPMGGLRDMTEWTVDCWNGLASYLDQDRALPAEPKQNHTCYDPTSFNLCHALWEDRTGENCTEVPGENQRGRVRHHHSRHGAGASDLLAHSRLSQAGLRIETTENDTTGIVTFSIVGEGKKSHDYSMDQPDEFTSREHQEPLKPRSTVKQVTSTWQRVFGRRPRRLLHHRQSGANICLTFSDDEETEETQTLFLPLPYASFGHAVVTGDFDGDGETELAVAAPHATLNPLVPSQGAVYIIPSQSLFSDDPFNPSTSGSSQLNDNPTKNNRDVRTVASRILHGQSTEPQSRFGWSLAVVDLNQDGIDDLAIGAPGVGAKDLRYDGSVFVYFGRAGLGLSDEPDLVLRHDPHTEGAIPTGFDSLAGLGYVVQGLDLTGSGFKDMVLGLPMATVRAEHTEYIDAKKNETAAKKKFRQQAGRVLVFFASESHNGEKLDSDRDWELRGQDSYEWFGASIAVIRTQIYTQTWPWSTQDRILVVGSPTFGVGEQDSMRGKIQGFLVPSRRSRISLSKPTFIIHGDARFQQFGSRLASRLSPTEVYSATTTLHDLLIVGSQSEDILKRLPRVGRLWQAGKVRVLDISRMLKMDNMDALVEVTISDLDLDPRIVRDSMQGSQSMAHLSAAMGISTDGQTLWLTEPYAEGEVGRILEWFPNLLEVEKERELFKVSRVVGIRGRKPVEILPVLKVGRVRDGDGDGGEGDDDDDDDDDGVQDRVRQCFIGSDYRGRFGSQLLVADLNRDGKDNVIVTSSHSSKFAIMAGTLTIKLRP